jgi:hypothetical protein
MPPSHKSRPLSRRILSFACLSAAALPLLISVGCGGGGGGGGSTTPTTKAKWTVLVYLNGANNLQQFGPLNVNQMEQVGSDANVKIVVQWKQATCSDCGTTSWKSTRRYLITKNNDISQNGGNGVDNIGSTLVQDLGANVDAGDWRTLHDFIAWGQQNYPADHYALVVWDHGSGWYPINGYTARAKQFAARAVSFDDATRSEIDIWQLSQALSAATKLDMVIWDASLMQMTEVAYEIRNSTNVVVGSEESPPGYGYPYQVILADLAGNPNMTPAQFGTDIVDQTVAYYTTHSNLNPSQDNTQSAIDTSKLNTLGVSMDTFATSLLAHATDSAAALATARTSAENYAPSEGYSDFKDLYDYADIVKNGVSPADLKTAAGNVQQAITSALIDNKHGPNHPRSHALTIYVPPASGYLTTYGNLAFAQNTHWSQWLTGQTQ